MNKEIKTIVITVLIANILPRYLLPKTKRGRFIKAINEPIVNGVI